MIQTLDWINIKDGYHEYDSRVLVYSPKYEDIDKQMLYRITSGQFVQRMNDVTHWAYLID